MRRTPSLGLGGALFALGVLALPSEAIAYPTSVVFAPNADVLPLGGITGGAYVGFQYTPGPMAMSSSWGGLEGGILPSFTYAKTPLGELGFGGAEIGVDGFGPDFDGAPSIVFNLKIQPFQETDYLPALSLGVFQLSPDLSRGAFLGFAVLSKSFTIRGTSLGQVTFGGGFSFADGARVSPGCLLPGRTCVFRGSAPFEDQNGLLFAGYHTPWIGPVGVSVDYVGGTSAVSSINAALNVRLLSSLSPQLGEAFMGIGLWFSSDRREAVSPGGVPDGFFVQMAITTSVQHMLGLDGKKEPDKPPPPKPEVSGEAARDPAPKAEPAPCPPCPACPDCPTCPTVKPQDPPPKPTSKPPQRPPQKPPQDFDP